MYRKFTHAARNTLITITLAHGLLLSAAPLEVDGVLLERSITLGGATLKLNGAGTRHVGPFKVNVSSIYAQENFKSLDGFIAQPGPKRISLTLLREVSSKDMGKTFTRLLEDNTLKGQMSKMIPGILTVSNFFSSLNKTIAKGETVNLDWIPGTGLTISMVGGLRSEAIKEPEFFSTLAAGWIGSTPNEHRLRDAMLGIESKSISANREFPPN